MGCCGSLGFGVRDLGCWFESRDGARGWEWGREEVEVVWGERGVVEVGGKIRGCWVLCRCGK